MGSKTAININDVDASIANIARVTKEASDAFAELSDVSYRIGTPWDAGLGKWDQAQSMPDPNNYTGHIVATGTASTSWPSVVPSSPYGNPFHAQPWVEPMTSTDADIKKLFACSTHHTLGADLMEIKDDHVVGTCEECGIRVFIPRVPGAFSFEQAGVLMGRAMGIMEDDEELAADLLTEIQAAQEHIDKDIRRHKLAMEMLQMAKGMAKKAALKIAEPIE